MYFLAMHSGLVPQATLSANASGCRGNPEKRPRSPREKALPGYADGIHAPPGPHPVPHLVTQVQAPAGPHHSPASQVTWRPGQARAQPKNGSHTQNTEPRQVCSLAQLNDLAILSPDSTPRYLDQYTYFLMLVWRCKFLFFIMFETFNLVYATEVLVGWYLCAFLNCFNIG